MGNSNAHHSDHLKLLGLSSCSCTHRKPHSPQFPFSHAPFPPWPPRSTPAEVLLLLRMLGPGRPPITPAHFSWTKLWAALLVENLLIPFCMAYTAYSPYIVWSGVRYCKQGGKVVRAKTAP